MANLFLEVAIAMKEGLEEFIHKRWNENIELRFNPIDLSFENYARWERTGEKDKQLASFLMTNQQMFWFTLAHRYFLKYQKGNNFLNHRSQCEHLHVWIKSHYHFRKGFHCDSLSLNEIHELDIVYESK